MSAQTTYEKLATRLGAKVEENERYAVEAFNRAIDRATGTSTEMEFVLYGDHFKQFDFLLRYVIEKHGFPEGTTICGKYCGTSGYTHITLYIPRAKKVEVVSTPTLTTEQFWEEYVNGHRLDPVARQGLWCNISAAIEAKWPLEELRKHYEGTYGNCGRISTVCQPDQQ